MFNTNKTLEQKVKASMATSLHRAFIERSVIILPSDPHIYSRTDSFTLSGFTIAFKAALNGRNSTGHRVAYIIMMGLMHPQRQRRRNDSHSSYPLELPSEPWHPENVFGARLKSSHDRADCKSAEMHAPNALTHQMH